MSINKSAATKIQSIVEETVRLIPDRELSRAILKAFEEEQLSLFKIEGCFDRLTARPWPKPVLDKFFHGWRATHLSSSSVSALTCRLLALAEQGSDSGHHFIRAAQAYAKIVHEDLGLCGETHAKLYERLANTICGDDQWKLSANRIISSSEFGNWVHHQRVVATIETGLLTTIASEIYNHGEYSFAAPAFRTWMENSLGLTSELTRRSLAYIVVHTGTTESDHFMHGIDALQHYYCGMGVPMDFAKVSMACAEYLRRVATAFAGLAELLDDAYPYSSPVSNLISVSAI